ncbi:MAG: hypothetical protein JWL90_286 [Chthoniobacteraceae bacterium]|nr:hypothetical protein [Chthoniobacteraceae bacterium]
MKQITLPIVELFGIATTRGLLGAGLALLLGSRLNRRKRRALGTFLTALGALSTLPFAYDILIRRERLPISSSPAKGPPSNHLLVGQKS